MELLADSDKTLSTEGAGDAAEEYLARELPESERRSTLSVTLVRMGYTVLATGLVYAALSTVGFAKGLTWVGRISGPLMLIAVLIAAVSAINHADGWNQNVNGKPA